MNALQSIRTEVDLICADHLLRFFVARNGTGVRAVNDLDRSQTLKTQHNYYDSIVSKHLVTVQCTK